MALSSPARVEAPSVLPARGGLLQVANVVEASDPHAAFGVEYFTFLCGSAGVAPGLCEVAPGVEVDDVKQFTGGQTVTGNPFAVYAGVVCDLFGAPYATQARDRLTGSEDRVVARAFQQAVFAEFAGDAVDLGAASSLVALIAELEQYAGENYAGEPVLHMNRATATYGLAADVLLPDLMGQVATGQGTRVANSAGYPDGLVFVTGQVNMWRTAVEVHAVPDPQGNQAYALAERVYAVATDCLLAYGTFDPAAEGRGGQDWTQDIQQLRDTKVDRQGDAEGLWLGTQAEYDAISSKDPAVVYAVVQS